MTTGPTGAAATRGDEQPFGGRGAVCARGGGVSDVGHGGPSLGHPLGGMLGAKGPIGPIPDDTPQPSGDLR